MNQDVSSKFRIIICLLIFATLIGLACKRPEPKTKDNALERYINEPKEKAEAVKERIEAGQSQVDDALKELDDAPSEDLDEE